MIKNGSSFVVTTLRSSKKCSGIISVASKVIQMAVSISQFREKQIFSRFFSLIFHMNSERARSFGLTI